jgi:ABC-2 type transport system permease protein
VLISAVLAALLGTSMGLFVSAFATSEFQAVQLVMPSLMPQILLCGLFVPRERMNQLLQWLADVFPLTYSVDAMKQVSVFANWTGQLTRDFLVVIGFTMVSLIVGAVTIKRQES